MATLEELKAELARREAAGAPAAKSSAKASAAPKPAPAKAAPGVFPDSTVDASAPVRSELTPLESDINDFFNKPENQRLLMETFGGVAAAALAPELLIAKAVVKYGPRLGPLLARSFAAGTGQAGGSLVSEGIDPSEDPALSAAMSFGAGAAGEVGGAAAMAAGGKLLAPFANSLTTTGKKAIDLVTSKGGTITPGTAMDGPIIDKLESVARNSFLGGSRVLAKNQEAEEIAIGAVEDFAKRFSSTASKEEIGVVVQELIEDGSEAFRTTARGLYSQVDDLTKAAIVDMRPVKEAAQELLDRSERGVGSPVIRRLQRIIAAKPDYVPFSSAQELRSDLLGIGRQTTDIVASKGPSFGSALAKSVDDEMMAAGKSLGNPDALDAFRAANAFWKSGKETFNSKLIKGLARAEPEAVFERAVRAGRPGTIRSVRQTIDDPEAWKAIQGQYLKDILLRATDPAAESLVTQLPANRLLRMASGERILKDLARFGDDALKELFPEGVAPFVESARVLAQVQKRKTGGGLVVGLAEAGAALSLLSGVGNLGTATLALTPSALAYVMTSKMGSKWLTTGLKAPPGSREAGEAFAQLAAALIKEGLVESMETREPGSQ